MERNKNESNFRYGTLPGASAPLAIAYVPMQSSATPSYEAAEALSRGTLFPGLDLPFMNIVNDTQPVTPLTELMAIDFVTDELDGGPVILQAKVPVFAGDSEEEITARVQAQEHAIYPLVISWFVDGRLRMAGNHAWLDERQLPPQGYAADE